MGRGHIEVRIDALNVPLARRAIETLMEIAEGTPFPAATAREALDYIAAMAEDEE